MENNMSIKDAMIAFWTKAFVFKGRARRREVWLNILGNLIIAFILGILSLLIDLVTSYRMNVSEHYNFFVGTIFPYFTTIPAMAQASRRMQDINMNGKIAIVLTVATTLIDFVFNRIMPLFNAKLTGNLTTLVIISIILAIPMLFLFIINFINGNEGDNKYGKDPKRV